jgi:hypothetical protein
MTAWCLYVVIAGSTRNPGKAACAKLARCRPKNCWTIGTKAASGRPPRGWTCPPRTNARSRCASCAPPVASSRVATRSDSPTGTSGRATGSTRRSGERSGISPPFFCEGEVRISLAGTCQPRLEPEAVFGIAATPSAGASLDQLLDCLEWVAPGFELVQSHQPGWVFTAADTVADAGLHGRLLVGRRVPVAQVAPGAETFEERLARCRVTLWRGNEMVEAGAGPLHALQHLVRALRDCPGARASRRRRRHDRHLDRHLAGGAGPAMERAIRLATFHARSHLRLREKPCNTDSSARAI